jgi:hypothetical protein
VQEGGGGGYDEALTGMFDKTERCDGAWMEMSKVAFSAGSSKHGKAWRASAQESKRGGRG